MAKSATEGVGAIAGKAVDGMQDAAKGVGAVAGAAVDGVQNAADGVGNMAGKAVDGMEDMAGSAAEGAGGIAGSAVDGMKNLGQAAGSITEGIGNMFKAITLPGNIEINTPEGSFTQKMVTYLSSQDAANKTFAFDRLNLSLIHI